MALDTDRAKRYISRLLDIVETDGVSALSEDQKSYLGRLLVGDMRKGEFLAKDLDDDQLLATFCDHLRKSYIDDEYLVAIDFRKDLEQQARELSKEQYPVTSLILYATLVEHWLNGIIAVLIIRRGISPKMVKDIIRHVPFKGKLDWMLHLLGAPEVDENHRKAIEQLIELRNGYLHYKWTGRPLEEVEKEALELKQRLSDFENTVKYMHEYENEHISGEALSVCKRIFGIENPFDG